MNDRLINFRLGYLLSGMGLYLTLSCVAGSVLAGMLSKYLPLQELLAWLGSLFAANAYRALVWLKYRRGSWSQERLIGSHFTSTFLTALSWGSVSLLAVDRLPLTMEGVFVAFLMGVVTSGAVSNVADKKLAKTYVILVITPFMYKTLHERGEFYWLYLLGQVAYMYFMFILIKRFNAGLVRNAQLVYEKERLLSELTEKYDLERQLKEEKMKSLQASKFAAIGEMAAGVGHEINNPLTIVLGYHWKMARLLRERGGDPEILELVNKSSEASKRIADIVKSMRDFSRVKEQGEMEEFNLGEVFDMVRPLLDKPLKHFEVNLAVEIEDCRARGIQSEFAQVLYNILTNAIHACEEGPARDVLLRGGSDRTRAFFSVSNIGDEIPDEIREKIFQPFFTTKAVGKGTGLGLSLARTIMENNHGEVYYQRVGDQNVFVMKMLLAEEGGGEKIDM